MERVIKTRRCNNCRADKRQCADCRRETRRVQQHEQRRRLIKAGICIECHKDKALDGFQCCQACSDFRRIKTAARRDRLRSKKKCLGCSAPSVPGRRRCPKCLRVGRARTKRRYRICRDRKTCSRCGKQDWRTELYSLCTPCHWKRRAYETLMRRRSYNEIRDRMIALSDKIDRDIHATREDINQATLELEDMRARMKRMWDTPLNRARE